MSTCYGPFLESYNAVDGARTDRNKCCQVFAKRHARQASLERDVYWKVAVVGISSPLELTSLPRAFVAVAATFK